MRKIRQNRSLPEVRSEEWSRSVYEALTDSCFSAVNEDALLYKRTNDYYKPALIRKERDGRYYLMTDEEVRSYKL